MPKPKGSFLLYNLKMPSSMFCPHPDCQAGEENTKFKTKECPTIELALKDLELHVNNCHVTEMSCNKCAFKTPKGKPDNVMLLMQAHVSADHNDVKNVQVEAKEEDPDSSRKPVVYKASKCTAEYRVGQDFESFEKEINVWKEATNGLPSHTLDMMFVEMLGKTSNPEVKEYFVKRIMNNGAVEKTTENIMKMLKEEFGKTLDQKWDETFNLPVNCDMKEGSAKDIWYKLEHERYKVKNIFKESECENFMEILDKMIIRNFVNECIKNEKINRGLQYNIEEKVKAAKYDWTKSKEILKEIVFNHDNVPISTNYVHVKSRTRNDRKFNRSSSRQERGRYDKRFSRSYQDRSGSRRRFRTSTPSGN